MVDDLFAVARLAELYDPLDPDRGDLDVYVATVEELGARRVLDLGCGTGTFACLLAGRGLEVTGVDPAEASLQVARRKPGAQAVRWVCGDAGSVPGVRADLVTMTGNVAQVFVDDDEWQAALEAVRDVLCPGGRLVFETRDPARRAWEEWTESATRRRVDVPDVGLVETWVELTEVVWPCVSFQTSFVFCSDGAVLTSHSMLRFRERAELTASLASVGLVVDEVRDAPDRPGREMVFVARKPVAPPGPTPTPGVEVGEGIAACRPWGGGPRPS